MKSFYFRCVVAASILLLSACTESGENMYITGDSEREYFNEITKTVGYRYHLFIPDYKIPDGGYPMLLFLHGAGERGNDLDLVKLHGINNMLTVYDPLPFIVISPQVPDGGWWDSESLNALIDHAVASYPVDTERIYVTGLSMGGYGTWDLIIRYPGRFAAAIPICGGGNWLLAHRAKDVPVLAFHGDADPVIPLERSVEMVEALQEAGGNATLTVYPGTGHDAWTPTYGNKEMYEWLLQFKRKSE